MCKRYTNTYMYTVAHIGEEDEDPVNFELGFSTHAYSVLVSIVTYIYSKVDINWAGHGAKISCPLSMCTLLPGCTPLSLKSCTTGSIYS